MAVRPLNVVPEGTGRPRRRVPRGWVVFGVAFLVYTTFRLIEMTVWLVRALAR